MTLCKVAGCGDFATWHVLRVAQWDRITNGPVHNGKFFAAYKVNHVRQAEKCERHAAAEADRRNKKIRDDMKGAQQ